MWPKINWLKVGFVVALYAAAFAAFNYTEASPTVDREMYCSIFQARFDAFGTSLRDGISPERIDKVIVESSKTDSETRMYQMMVRLLLDNDMYKDANAVRQFGMDVKDACVKGEF